MLEELWDHGRFEVVTEGYLHVAQFETCEGFGRIVENDMRRIVERLVLHETGVVVVHSYPNFVSFEKSVSHFSKSLLVVG